MKRKLLLAFCALLLGWSNAMAQETPSDNGIYYLYNSEADLFLSRGNNWGTQATAAPVGLPWKISVADGKYTLRMYDFTVEGSTAGFNGDYTDNATPIQLTPNGDASNGFTLQNGSNYVTCPATKGDVTMTTTASKWKFLTQAQYKSVLDGRATAQETAVATSKGIEIPLGKTLDEVVSDGDNWTSAKTQDAVPTSSTWTVTKFASPDWRGAATNWGNYGGELFQESNGHYTRTITGLSSGIYKVSVRAMKRLGTNGNCYTMGEAGYPVSDAYLKANGNIIPIKAWYEDCTANNAPNGPAAVVSIIENGGYTTEGFVYVGDDGNLVMDLASEAFTGSCWTIFNGISYTFYNNEVSDDEATAILEQADGLLLEEMDATIKSNLSDARNTFNGARTIANYNALNTAIGSAQSSADAYALFAPERTKAIALGMDLATVNSYAPNVQNLMVAEYNFVTTNYSYPVSLGTWTKTGETDENSGQHWDGTSESTYLEQLNRQSPAAGWWANSWEIGYDQDIALPAGDYVFKVAGRKSSNDVTLTLKVKKGANELGSVNDFPNGDTGKGINTSGATDFATGVGHTYAYDNNGRGWQWRYVKFTLAEAATVNIAITAETNSLNQWMGFCNPTVQTNNGATQKLIAYNIALSDAEKAIADDAYDNVTGSEKTALQDAIDADASLDKSDEDAIVAATNTLNSTRVAFTGAKSSYDNFVAAKAVEYEDNLPYASATKFAAIATAQGATATSASDAVAKTNAILSAYRLYVESNALAEGVGGINKTDLIEDANFSGVTIEEQTAGAWAFSQSGGSPQILSNQSFTDGDGNANYSYFDYNNGDNNNQHLTQTIEDLPVGQYLLTVTARAATTFNNYFFLKVTDGEDAVSVKIPAVGNSGGTFDRGWNDASLTFNHTTSGNVTIEVYSDGGSGSSKRSGWWGATRFRLAKIDKEVSITSSIGVATLYTPYALDFEGTGLSAYTATVEVDEVVVTKVDNVQANTGVILKGAQGNYNIPLAASSSTGKGDLTGNATDATAWNAFDGYDIYVLAMKGDDNAQFQKATSGSVAAGKAFLKISKGSNVKVFNIVDGTATGVEAPEVAEAEEEEEILYNTAGVRVGKDYKGIVINQKGEKRLQK